MIVRGSNRGKADLSPILGVYTSHWNPTGPDGSLSSSDWNLGCFLSSRGACPLQKKVRLTKMALAFNMASKFGTGWCCKNSHVSGKQGSQASTEAFNPSCVRRHLGHQPMQVLGAQLACGVGLPGRRMPTARPPLSVTARLGWSHTITTLPNRTRSYKPS